MLVPSLTHLLLLHLTAISLDSTFKIPQKLTPYCFPQYCLDPMHYNFLSGLPQTFQSRNRRTQSSIVQLDNYPILYRAVRMKLFKTLSNYVTLLCSTFQHLTISCRIAEPLGTIQKALPNPEDSHQPHALPLTLFFTLTILN